MKLRKNRAISTIQVFSSSTTMPPEPMIEPNPASDSKSTGRSRKRAGIQPPEGPPVCTDLNALPRGIPPPISKIMSRNEVPIGTSTSPLLAILPVRAKTAVPRLFSVPIWENHCAPSSIITGTAARVLTLLILDGFPSSPEAAGNGGRGRGMPRRPSIEAIKAVSSPQTKAPAPSLISISKSNPEPSMFFPRKPLFRLCARAIRTRLTARGYSARA
ncbi:MAG: hypothetical protein DDT25_00642 [Chloroflexi bacterium]|nr:hypothetical protein [Chloroflexota bacterium]